MPVHRPPTARRRGSVAIATSLVSSIVVSSIVVASVVAATLAAQPVGVVDASDVEEFIAEPGPLGPITVIGDSVLLGSLAFAPDVGDQLAALGWGPVRSRAGSGYRSGASSVAASHDVSNWITTWRQQGWDPVDVLVNLGANDSGFCYAEDVACARAAILHVVDAIGPGHRIWWPKITRDPTAHARQNTWNTALDQVASERPDVWTWDWPTEMATGGYLSHDGVHLHPDSYRKRSMVMARELTADVIRATRVGGDAALPVALGTPASYVPVAPRRVLDTRNGTGQVAADSHVAIDLRPFVPAGATAVAVNLTSDQSNAPGFLSGYPCDRPRGDVSSVNHGAGVARASLAVVPVSADGRLCVYTRAAGHVIVDLQGAFVPGATTGTRFTPLDPPRRLADTRETGRASVITVAAPAGAAAVAVNLTATNADAPGWLKAYPCDATPPEVSNVNYFPGDSVAGTAFVPVSASGTFCVETLVAADIVVDITGVFTADGELRFVAAQPTRVLDTRIALGGWSPLHGSGQTLDVRAVPPGARAVTGTITLVAPLRPGFLKSYPCGAEPPTSSVNAPTGEVLANGVTVGVNGDGRVCVTARAATHTLLDVTGWWVP